MIYCLWFSYSLPSLWPLVFFLFFYEYCQYCLNFLLTVFVSQMGGGQVGVGTNNSMINSRPGTMEESGGGYSGGNDNATNGLSPNQNQVKPLSPTGVDKSRWPQRNVVIVYFDASSWLCVAGFPCQPQDGLRFRYVFCLAKVRYDLKHNVPLECIESYLDASHFLMCCVI